MSPITPTDTMGYEETEEFDDPRIYRRLRDVGYSEEGIVYVSSS